MKPMLILCLGNDVLTDDAFGFRVAEEIEHDSAIRAHADVEVAALAGFALLDLLVDRKAVLIVDTIITGNAPAGTPHFYPSGYWTPSRCLVSSHQVNLPTALRFGQEMGYSMPECVDVLAVEAQDVWTLCETMTPPVQAAVTKAVLRIDDWVREKRRSVVLHGKRNKESALAG